MPGRPVPRVRSCLRSPHSTAYLQCRSYALKTLRGDDLGPISQDEYQTFRVRKGGKKLPLPPVLDPLVTAQRSHWEQKKNKPDVSKFTPFQKKLWENPYAHALASPVRISRDTSTLLPSHLLLTLHPTRHPTTTSPWLLPLTLTASPPPKNDLGPPIRIAASKHNTALLSRKKDTWRKTLYPRFFAAVGAKPTASAVWREDMPHLVETLIRDALCAKLRWYFQWRGRLQRVASPREEDLDGADDAGCVLFLGSLKGASHGILRKANEIVSETDKWSLVFAASFGVYFDPHKGPARPATHTPPGWYEPLVPRLAARARFPPLEFPTAQWRGRKVALYSLTDLLGEERARGLVAGTEYEGGRCWVVRRGRHTVPLELLLMQVQSWFAEPEACWALEP